MRLRWFLYDWRCGLHSGIPVCCIAFYTLVAQPLIWGRPHPYRAYWWLISQRRSHGLDFDHVPCPLCLVRGHVVTVRDCTCADELARQESNP